LPPLEAASFTVRGFNPRLPRLILFLHPEKKLVGVLEPPVDKTLPVSVQLRPGAVVTGRLVDSDGNQRANVQLSLAVRTKHDAWAAYFPGKFRTDQKGRFQLEALLPGQQYNLYGGGSRGVYFGEELRAGERKDLGDVQTKTQQ
jgi:hypothetical protein